MPDPTSRFTLGKHSLGSHAAARDQFNGMVEIPERQPAMADFSGLSQLNPLYPLNPLTFSALPG